MDITVLDIENLCIESLLRKMSLVKKFDHISVRESLLISIPLRDVKQSTRNIHLPSYFPKYDLRIIYWYYQISIK